MAVSDWSATADENTTVDGINIAEHCPAKNMNNALRAVMAALKTKCDALDSTDNTLRRGAVIGEVRWFAMSTPPEGWLVCNGAAVGTANYPALYNAIGKLFLPKDTPDLPDIFFLPNLMGKVPWGSSSQVGTEMKAGLPEIYGDFSQYRNAYTGHGLTWGGAGAFATVWKLSTRSIAKFASDGNYEDGEWWQVFSANRYNPIYGASTTVQPPALCLLPCIRYE